MYALGRERRERIWAGCTDFRTKTGTQLTAQPRTRRCGTEGYLTAVHLSDDLWQVQVCAIRRVVQLSLVRRVCWTSCARWCIYEIATCKIARVYTAFMSAFFQESLRSPTRRSSRVGRALLDAQRYGMLIMPPGNCTVLCTQDSAVVTPQCQLSAASVHVRSVV